MHGETVKFRKYMVNMQGYKVVPFSSFQFYETPTQMFNSCRDQSPLLFSLG